MAKVLQCYPHRYLLGKAPALPHPLVHKVSAAYMPCRSYEEHPRSFILPHDTAGALGMIQNEVVIGRSCELFPEIPFSNLNSILLLFPETYLILDRDWQERVLRLQTRE